jgi:outer membrane protein assembly factor BamB
VVADGIVYVATGEFESGGKLYAFDAPTGNKLWELGFRTPLYTQPVISDGWAYVVTEAGELFGLRGEATGPPPVGPQQADPTDPDSDGQYEDVDGDGDVDIADVQTLYNAQGSSTVQSHTSAFDFNNSGDISIGDVQALFKEYLSR